MNTPSRRFNHHFSKNIDQCLECLSLHHLWIYPRILYKDEQSMIIWKIGSSPQFLIPRLGVPPSYALLKTPRWGTIAFMWDVVSSFKFGQYRKLSMPLYIKSIFRNCTVQQSLHLENSL